MMQRKEDDVTQNGSRWEKDLEGYLGKDEQMLWKRIITGDQLQDWRGIAQDRED